MATRRIAAPAETIYGIIADYRNGHRHILPKQFHSLVVEQGGIGASTIIRCQMRTYGRTQVFRAVITEPRPGRELMETNLDGVNSVTTFLVEPVAGTNETDVTITTDLKVRNGWPGRLEGYLSHRLLYPMYLDELELLDIVARK